MFKLFEVDNFEQIDEYYENDANQKFRVSTKFIDYNNGDGLIAVVAGLIFCKKDYQWKKIYQESFKADCAEIKPEKSIEILTRVKQILS